MAAWYRFDGDRNVLCINLYVQPNARSTEVVGKHGEALKVRVAAPPLDARANQLLIDFLGKTLGVPGSRIRISRGGRSRHKLVEIVAPDDTALRTLRGWEQG
jgi:uncharacterized protein (TIGR00251 family)